jgi:formyl-CoA transferase
MVKIYAHAERKRPTPIWIRGQEKARPRPAPTVGEHNEEVLCAAGFTVSEIAALRDAGVIG